MTLRFDSARTALLLIDVQRAFLEWEAEGKRRNNPGALQAITGLLGAFRNVGAPIVHVRHRSANEASRFYPKAGGFAVIEAARELQNEMVVEKTVNSAFIGTDLDQRLREDGIEALVVVGITTNHCVETTTRMAGNLGYRTVLVSDATYTFDRTGPDGRVFKAEDIQDMTLANLHDEFCTVMASAEVERAISA